MTVEKVELGKMLYFDKRLSGDDTIACATCHDPAAAFAEHKAVSEGIKGQKGERNAPTVLNAAYHPSQFWDGRAKTLEEQALMPIENPIEMGIKLGDVVAKLNAIEGYRRAFKKAFGTEVTAEGIAKAIAAFERTLLSGDSPYDRYMAGDKKALGEEAKRGLELFTGKALCAACHTPPTFSNGAFVNAGVGTEREKPDEGRKKVSGSDADWGSFRVPSLRNVADTAPYTHNGSIATLEEMVAFMAGGGRPNRNLNLLFKAMPELTAADKADLVAFLRSLSGEKPKVSAPKLP